MSLLPSQTPSHQTLEQLLASEVAGSNSLRFSGVFERLWLVALSVLLLGGAALVYLFTSQPVFESTVALAFDRGPVSRVTGESGTSLQGNFLQTQAEVVRSGAVLGRVAANPAVTEIQSLRGTSLSSELRRAVSAAASIRSDVLYITARSTDRDDARKIANLVAEEYVSLLEQNRLRRTDQELEYLQNRRAQLVQERRKADDDRLNFARTHRLAILPQANRTHPELGRLDQIGREVTRVQIELEQARAAARTAEAVREQADENPEVARGLLQSSEYQTRVGALRNELRSVQRQMLVLAESLSPGSSVLRQRESMLQAITEEIESEERDLLDAYIKRLANRITELEFQKNNLERAFAELKTRIETEDGRLQETYAGLLKIDQQIRSIDNEIGHIDDLIRRVEPSRELHSGGTVLVMDKAEGAMQVAPRWAQTLIGAVVAGLVLGVGLALLVDLLDTRIRSADEIREVLALPLLGVIPHILRGQTPADRGRVVDIEPMSDESEAYRTVRTALFFGSNAGRAKTFLFTSPQPAEGKSTLVSNLGIAMAQAGSHVVIVDADFRKPSQHRIFKLDRSSGASSVLAGEKTLDEAILPSGVEGLDVLPCGAIPANPSEVVNSAAFRQMLGQLSERYDIVLVDSPPVLPVTDARILSAICDLTVLAIRVEKTSRKAAGYARDVLTSTGAKLIGVVVNDLPRRRSRSSYYRNGFMYTYGYGHATRRVPPNRAVIGEDAHVTHSNGDTR